MGEPIETYYADGVWRNSVGRNGPPLGGEYQSREAALADARDAARVRGVEHVVRDEVGTVVQRNRYPRRSEEIPG
ncbi:DUF2188 domain-containing protein [Nocardioides sp. URHA0020]|uniref:DUF2188 domain-containing protein n=1 Tax=Nocardioides sp. URHA0020 TaxID=1380392 RepID=UPI00048A569C|nr:DUF2188 domain-containing protein [Nocardioides sp. URHA0020]